MKLAVEGVDQPSKIVDVHYLIHEIVKPLIENNFGHKLEISKAYKTAVLKQVLRREINTFIRTRTNMIKEVKV